MGQCEGGTWGPGRYSPLSLSRLSLCLPGCHAEFFEAYDIIREGRGSVWG